MGDNISLENAHPEFAMRVRDSFERQGLMKHLGAHITHLQSGKVEIRVPYRNELTQ